MKRFAALAAVLLLLCVGGFALAEEAGTAPDEWTVLFYFCGSDLESRYGFASDDLKEISDVMFPYDYSVWENFGAMRDVGKVNVLIETGGSRAWHTKEKKIDIDVSADALQRWRLNYYHPIDWHRDGDKQIIELVDTLPLQNMSAPETLADFIRWGAENYPAKKYALVLWGHGNGAKTGLFIDELFDNDVMYLYELKQALADGGIRLETVVIDACLMGSVETAWAISESANWMVASEEVIPGSGTALEKWLQALVNYPGKDGRWLGRCICDLTAFQYANDTDNMARSLMTWSVIDLSRIGQVVQTTEKFFSAVGEAIKSNAILIRVYAGFLLEAEEYGDGGQDMRDLGSLYYNDFIANYADLNLMDELIGALSDAVVYTVRGPGRSAARGLSFCYPAGSSAEELDTYAKNFPMPAYLAYLDAISSWNAPEWVYEQTEKLPGIDTIEELQVTVEKTMTEKGVPALAFPGEDMMVKDVRCNLYKLDEETNEILRLGQLEAQTIAAPEDKPYALWTMDEGMKWLTVEGEPCCAELIKYDLGVYLYSVPVRINSETKFLRCGRITSYDAETDGFIETYEAFGVWEGYDENSVVMTRGVMPLTQAAGRVFCLLYPKDSTGKNERTFYASGDEMTMPRALRFLWEPLPAGTYYLEFELHDAFQRDAVMDRIEIRWDGERMTFPEGFTWEGSFRVEWAQWLQ